MLGSSQVQRPSTRSQTQTRARRTGRSHAGGHFRDGRNDNHLVLLQFDRPGTRKASQGREPSGARCHSSEDIGRLKVQQAYGMVWMGFGELFETRR